MDAGDKQLNVRISLIQQYTVACLLAYIAVPTRTLHVHWF